VSIKMIVSARLCTQTESEKLRTPSLFQTLDKLFDFNTNTRQQMVIVICLGIFSQIS